MKKKILSIALALAMVFAFTAVFSGCGGEESADDGQVYTLKLAHIVSETDNLHLGALDFEKDLEELSDGRIQVEIYGNGTLAASDADLVNLINDDSVQMGLVATYILGIIDEDLQTFGIYDMPYMFRTTDEYYAFAESDYGLEMQESILAETGNVKALNPYPRSWMKVSTSKKEVRTPKDLKGLKIRCSSIPNWTATLEGFGASATAIDFSEAFTALQQGVIDGQQCPTNFYISQRFFEVQKYLTPMNTCCLWNFTLVSNKWYEALPDDLKECVDTALDNFTKNMRDLGEKEEQDQLDQLQDKMTCIELTPEEQQEWIDTGVALWPKMYDSNGGKEHVEKVNAFLEEYRANQK